MYYTSYGSYMNARDAVWQTLIDYRIHHLPVNLAQVARQANILVIQDREVHELQEHEIGASLYDGGQWYIVYDHTTPRGRLRFTIAHILLGHTTVNGRHSRKEFDLSKPKAEKEADTFASRLLAPACVLWGLNLHTPEEIMRVCDISYSAAKIRAERMAVLYQRQKFLTSPLERQVYEQFKDFIAENKQK